MTDFHYVQNVDNSRVVRVADPRRRREQWLLAVAIATTFVLLFGYAWQNYRMIGLGYQIEDARQAETGLTQWNQALRLEQASLRDPIRIYTLAEDRLGMASARPGQVAALETTPLTPQTGGAVLAEARRPAAAAAAGMGSAR